MGRVGTMSVSLTFSKTTVTVLTRWGRKYLDVAELLNALTTWAEDADKAGLADVAKGIRSVRDMVGSDPT